MGRPSESRHKWIGADLKTTRIAGVKSGNHSNPKVLADAKEGNTPWPLAKKASGGACGEAEGGAARPRLDRPGRKMGGAAPNTPVKEWMKKDGGECMAGGGKLTANARKHIAPKNFALPGRRYPIEDASHARNALARVSQHGSSQEKAKVRAAVHRKYPGIGKDKS